MVIITHIHNFLLMIHEKYVSLLVLGEKLNFILEVMEEMFHVGMKYMTAKQKIKRGMCIGSMYYS